MTDATRHFTPEEIALNELDLTERARLCDPIRLQHDLAALRRISAANAERRAAATEPLKLQPTPELVGQHWQLSVNRADPQLVAMYERHYSCHQYKDGRKRKQAVAPGQYIALMTAKRDALWIWSKQKYRADKQQGINCAVFRNESTILSSELIREAVEIAQRRWPGERLFTFVDASKIKSKNPGYCFKLAGWKPCGKTATGLLIFEWTRPVLMTVKLPADLIENVDQKLSLDVKVEAA